MKHPPYHLRVNKAVDRLLLVELLRTIGSAQPPLSDFTYYGFGGPFLEDLKLIDEYLPEVNLVSIESNKHTRLRQELHRFSSRVRLFPTSPDVRGTLNDFLTHFYSPGVRDIFWLDYTDLKYACIQEFQRVIGLVPLGSIVRITLRAELDYTPKKYEKFLDSESYIKLVGGIKAEFDKVFGKVLSQSAEELILDSDKFPSVLLDMLREAAEEVMLEAQVREFVPVHTIIYNDNTRMLTLTGIVATRGESGVLKERYKTAKFASFEWGRIQRIELPVLSLREVMKLAPHLPEKGSKGGELWEALGYNIADAKAASEAALTNHGEFHRYHPQFVRMSV